MGLICFECKQEIAKGAQKHMYGLEKPYINLFFHQECWLKVRNWIEQYVQERSEMVYNYAREVQNNSQK